MATSTVHNLFLVFSNINNLTLAATILIAIIGWIVALLLQRTNAREEHKIEVRYDIYKQLLEASQKTQDILVKLSVISPPLISMEGCMIPFKLKLTKEHKGQWVPYREEECVLDGGKKWQEFVSDYLDKYFSYSSQYHLMIQVFDGWAAAIEPLLKVQRIFSEEESKLQRQMYEAINKLQMYSSDHGYDWRRWNKKDVESISAIVRDSATTISSYILDFTTLIHNELLSKYFGYYKPIRKTLDPKYRVLTEEGLVVRLEGDHERKLAEALNKIRGESKEESK